MAIWTGSMNEWETIELRAFLDGKYDSFFSKNVKLGVSDIDSKVQDVRAIILFFP